METTYNNKYRNNYTDYQHKALGNTRNVKTQHNVRETTNDKKTYNTELK